MHSKSKSCLEHPVQLNNAGNMQVVEEGCSTVGVDARLVALKAHAIQARCIAVALRDEMTKRSLKGTNANRSCTVK
jgi:hypothetical protein